MVLQVYKPLGYFSTVTGQGMEKFIKLENIVILQWKNNIKYITKIVQKH